MNKIFVRIVVVLFALLVAIGLLGQFYLDDLVEEKLKKIIQTQNDRLYDYKFDQVEVRVWSGDVIISNLSVTPRISDLDSISKDHGDRPTIFSLDLKEFKLEGLKIKELLLDGMIVMGGLNLEKPIVNIYKQKTDKKNTGTKDLVSEIIIPEFVSIDIGFINLNNAKLDLYRIGNDTLKELSFDSLSYTIEQIYSTPEYFKNETFFEFENMKLDLKNIKVHSLKDHDLRITNAHFDMESNEFRITGFRLKPNLDRFEFMKNTKYETDWIDVAVDTLLFKQLDLKKFQASSELHLEEIEIINPIVSLYRDKRLPDPPYQYKALLSSSIRNINTSINIKRIQINEGTVKYSEWGEVAKKPGTIELNNITANITNITSDSMLLSYNDTMKFHCTANFMDQSVLSADYTARLLDPKDRFQFKASVRNLNFTSLNPLTEHLLEIKFSQGKLNYISFWMNGNDFSSTGRLDIDYEGLKDVQIIIDKNNVKDKPGKKHQNQKKLYTFLANTYILNDYNPDHKEYFQGRIKFQRIQNKFLINYIVKSMVTGLESSLLPIMQSDFKDMRKEKRNKRKKAKKIKN